MSGKPSEFEQHQFLAKLIDGSQKRDKSNLERVKYTLDVCKTQTKLPELALVAYCYLGDLERVKELAHKEVKVNEKTLRAYLFQALESGNNHILKVLFQGVKTPTNALIRAAISKACSLGHNEQLKTLLNKAPKNCIDEATLRFAGINALLDRKYDIFVTICKYAKDYWLEDWETHLKTELKVAGIHNKHTYTEGLILIQREKLKRQLVKTIQEENHQEFQV
jgi:hypothetical protein